MAPSHYSRSVKIRHQPRTARAFLAAEQNRLAPELPRRPGQGQPDTATSDPTPSSQLKTDTGSPDTASRFCRISDSPDTGIGGQERRQLQARGSGRTCSAAASAP